MVNYKFNEGALIQELQDYIDSTYDGHYSKNQFQSTEFIIDCGHGMGFALGNVLKYAQRYGKKDGANRKDLMKILHYALIALHQHDLDNQEEVQLDLDFDDFTIDLSNSDSISLSGMYNVDDMSYNSSMDSITVDLDSNITTLTYGNSIDDATPEEWNQASKKAYKGKPKK
jgi:hypothetical protein